MWGAAPRPGRAKFALHPRHVLRTCPSETRRMRAHGLPLLAVLRAVARPQPATNLRNLRFPTLAVLPAVAGP